MAEEKDPVEGAKEEEKPKKSPIKWIILAVALIIVGAGGYLGWAMYEKGDPGSGQGSAGASKVKKEEVSVVLPLKSFIVNLRDKAGLGKRYLKVTMELEVGSEENRKLVERHTPQLRDTILLLLSSLSFNEINTLEGKLELKQALLSRVNQILGQETVRRVYFSEFVVQ